jgi:hypothetical protein
MIIVRNNFAMLSRNDPSRRYTILISNDTFLRRAWSLICSFLISTRQYLVMRCLRTERPSYPNVQAPFPLIVYLWRRKSGLERTVVTGGTLQKPLVVNLQLQLLGDEFNSCNSWDEVIQFNVLVLVSVRRCFLKLFLCSK